METIPCSSLNPLFSTVATLYTLILLYFPQVFVKLLFSPLLLSTLALLLYLLRLGASQQQQQQLLLNTNTTEGTHALRLVITQNGLEPGHEPQPKPESESNEVESAQPDVRIEGEVAKPQRMLADVHSTSEPDPRPETEICDPGQSVDVDLFSTHDQEKEKESFPTLDWAKLEPAIGPKLFPDWDVGEPLEVIYEEHEGDEEAGDEAQNDAFWKAGTMKRYPSLSQYYPESESDSSSSSISSEEEDAEREGLIEIALDSYAYNGDNKVVVNMIMNPKFVAYQTEVDGHFDDEDNLIEIDISPTKNMSAFSW